MGHKPTQVERESTQDRAIANEWARFFADVVSTAVQGGGLPWAEVREYRWHLPGGPAGGCHAECSTCAAGDVDAAAYAAAALVDRDDPDTVYSVDATALLRALNTINGGFVPGLRSPQRRALLMGYFRRDAGDVDALAAGQLVQVALFGQVTYLA